MALNNLFSELLNEFYTLAEAYSKLGVLDDEDTKFDITKEVSPPDEKSKDCSCENCTCSRDINKNEDYTTSVTTQDYDNKPELIEKTCCDCEMCSEVNAPTYNDNGWVYCDGRWTKDVFVPVDNEHTEVNILDGTRVQVAYEQSVRRNETNMSGYSYQSGSFAFPLPQEADVSTFKAKRVGSYIELSVSPLTKVEDFCCVRVNIED
jgi:hypothetical protein